MNSTDTLVIIAPEGCREDGRQSIRRLAKRDHPGGVIVLPHGCIIADVAAEAIRVAVAAEREACAKVAEAAYDDADNEGRRGEIVAAEIAVAIRVRT